MKYSRMFMFLVLMAAAAASFGAYNAAKPADNEYVADVPALVRENFRAIKDDAIVNAGTVSGLSVGNASGNIPRSNGTLNINLNADKLDNFHGSDYVATTTVQTIKNKTIDSTNSVADAAVASTIARDSELAAVSSACNASDALNLRLNGSRAMTGSLKFSGNYGILQSTSDGADNALTSISGGGERTYDRGGHIKLFGNEYSSVGGQVNYFAGNVSGGDHIFYTGAGTERFRIRYDGTSTFSGNLLIGTTTDDGENKLQVNGYIYASKYKLPNNRELSAADSGGTQRTLAYISATNINYLGNTSYQTNLLSNGTLTHNGNTVWTAASDGAGSGLEADKIPLTAPSTPANGQIWLQ